MYRSTRSRDLHRLANRAKRQAMAQVPPLRWLSDATYQRRRRQWESQLPPLDQVDATLVDRLNVDAIDVRAVDDYRIPGTSELKSALDRALLPLRERDSRGVSTLRPSQDEMVQDLALWHWGLQERLLDIVENYLGVPARYYGADVRREVADRAVSGVRQWHRDIEDRRMVKILVWLNNVDDQGGPFAYIPVEDSVIAARHLRYVAGFVSNARLHSVVPEDRVRTVTGPRWTALMADNTRLMHRATPPTARDRYSVTFTWSSRRPIKTVEPVPWTAEQGERIRRGLNKRQLACLPTALQS